MALALIGQVAPTYLERLAIGGGFGTTGTTLEPNGDINSDGKSSLNEVTVPLATGLMIDNSQIASTDMADMAGTPQDGYSYVYGSGTFTAQRVFVPVFLSAAAAQGSMADPADDPEIQNYATNDVERWRMPFPAIGDSAWWMIVIPAQYDDSVDNIKLLWSGDGTSASWKIRTNTHATDVDGVWNAWSTTSSEDTNSAGEWTTTTISDTDLFPTGTAGRLAVIEVQKVTTSATAYLHGIIIEY
jgi:hypothetical protein